MFLVGFLFAFQADALEISRRYRSPRNPERKIRSSTELIVLHTTEAPARSSLNKLSDRGEAHFCVTEEGNVYMIVDRNREAFHAGRSMWRGREDVDKFSIGIECVGYHDKAMPTVQIAAIRDLLRELKRQYRISDDRVVCHSHVAYGSPNKWHRRCHRGRKRCGMLFATTTVRRMLELTSRPSYDADTRAGRLVVGDQYLQSVLYGGVDTMASKYGRTGVAGASKPVKQTTGGWFSSMFSKKAATSTVSSGSAVSSATVARSRAASPPVDRPASVSRPAAGDAAPKTIAQLQAGGYQPRGKVSKTVSALRLAGKRWNAADTYYTIRDKVYPGNTIDAAHIELGMMVWMKNLR